eukprot:UN08905
MVCSVEWRETREAKQDPKCKWFPSTVLILFFSVLNILHSSYSMVSSNSIDGIPPPY